MNILGYIKKQFFCRIGKKIRENTLGKNHPHYSFSCNNLARIYLMQGAYHESEKLYLEAIDLIKKNLGENHPYYAKSFINLSEVYIHQGNYKKSESLLKKALEIIARVLGEEHPDYLNVYGHLAGVYGEQGLYFLAHPLFIELQKRTPKSSSNYH